MKKRLLLAGILLLALIFLVSILYFLPKVTSGGRVSGWYFGHQKWSGEITVSGDVLIIGDLIVEPGTKVSFVVGDDQKSGDEIPPDGFNDNDPTRLRSYTITHSGITVLRRFIARGTKDQKIIFTSVSQTPALADWESIVFFGNGSVVDNVIVNYSRNGLNPVGRQNKSVIQNSIVEHTLWGAISTAHSGISAINNYLADSGHEGFDVGYEGAGQVIRGNTIENCHTAIVVLGGSPLIENNTIKNCGDGIFIEEGASPTLENNSITLAPIDSPLSWRYGDYVIPVFDVPK
ncbi:right-handed parallel beta-helix repeat-containing protein [Candidatus Microgenomates bacterium]|nr:right-handed parallel beta-helix repeat-containing protein [Candidatus Microgenomates bacterium]